MRQHRLSFVVCSGVLVFALGAAAGVLPGVASADATDHYPIRGRTGRRSSSTTRALPQRKPKIAPATRRTMNPSGTVDFMCPENTAIDRSLRAASALLRGTSKSKRSQSNGHMHQ
jgi:hypothetical protein